MRLLQLKIVFLAALLLTSTHSFAATSLSLATLPFGLKGMVDPNIMFTLDDSGSMQYEFMPESAGSYQYLFPPNSSMYGSSIYTSSSQGFDESDSDNFFIRSSANNTLFYNPDITYLPWVDEDGESMGDANPKQAYRNPKRTSAGSLDLLEQRDVTTSRWDWNCRCYRTTVLYSYSYMTYYKYNGGGRHDLNSYTKVQITQADYDANSKTFPFTGPEGADTRTTREEAQNFANWYQYYRSRILAARAGIGRAFADQGSNMRVGFAAINYGSTSVDGVATNGAVINGVRPFNGSDRENFFTQLYDHPIPTSGTPLRLASKRVGEYYKRTDNRGPWGDSPGENIGSSSDHLTCRQSYHILMTDGYWSGSNPYVGNADGSNGTTITGPDNETYQYVPVSPYKDDTSNTLADVAMEYWKQDLRPDIDNRVPVKEGVDPAFWQHLVTFTVGLGVAGSIDPATSLKTIDWPSPNNDPRKIDDLWHAAVNGRGEFFSAGDPETFADSLSNILNRITDRTSSTSSAASNSGTVSEGLSIFQARFKTGDWSGQLIKNELVLNPVTQLFTLTEIWDAAKKFPTASNRKIFSYDNNAGITFSAGQLTSASLKKIDGGDGTKAADIVNYIRGVQSKEANKTNGIFRNRQSLLGDIVNSSPQYVGVPSMRYSDTLEAQPYSTFKTTYKDRGGVIYVGANDGMLHAFDADTGVELFAYVPKALHSKLEKLTDQNYGHAYFVDATPTVVDAFINNSWKTILVSGLGAGGQGIFALDVTDPEDMSADKVLWEFTDETSAELGYTFGEPSIIKLNNDTWAALFTGGYNNNVDNAGDGAQHDSTSGAQRIYLLDLATGEEITTFSIDADATQANGFSTPVAVDYNGNHTADAIYVGDLLGNMWKIDISSSDKSTWNFANNSNGTPQPLFKAGETQPITTRPVVVRHKQTGYLVLFGTGKLLEAGDDSQDNQNTQRFYAVWDKDNSTNITPANLQPQQIQTTITESGVNYRIVSKNAVDWTSKKGWYMDLDQSKGERQISNAIARNGKIIFTTHIPALDPCSELGAGWLMEVDAQTGARLDYSPFDVNNDGKITSEDLYYTDGEGSECENGCAVSGGQFTQGNSSRPLIIDLGDNQNEVKLLSDSADGSLKQVLENAGPGFVGRQSWRLLREK